MSYPVRRLQSKYVKVFALAPAMLSVDQDSARWTCAGVDTHAENSDSGANADAVLVVMRDVGVMLGGEQVH